MRCLLIAAAAIACALAQSALAVPGVCTVREHGAVGDGRTLDTAAFNGAIAACAAAGGGRLDDVQISNVTMHDVATPFSLTLAPGNTAGRIAVNGMTATGVYRAALSIESWAEEPVESMTLRDVNLEFTGGWTR